MKQLKTLDWKLISALAAIGLIRPFISIAGFDGQSVGTWLPILLTVIISVCWIALTLIYHAPNPFLTLIFAGGLYGIFAIVLQQFIWNVLGIKPNLPEAIPPIAYFMIVVTNLIGGAGLGVIALMTRRILLI
jgi:hypothetical protein